MKFQLRLPRRQAEPKAVDPGSPHWFSQTYDPGASAMASGSGLGLGYGTIGSVSVADGLPRTQRCEVPGCNRDRYDPIHELASD